MTEQKKSTLEEAFQCALNMHRNGELIEAGAIYEKLLEFLPDNLDILYNYSILLLSQGIATKPQELIQRAISISPEMKDLYLLKINALRLSRNYELAHDALEDYEKRFPSDLEIDAQRLLIFHSQQLEKIITKSRNLYIRKDFLASEKILLDALNDYNNDNLLFQPIGELYLSWGKPLKAIEFLENACQKDRFNFNAWNQKGIVLMYLRKYILAHQAFVEALKILPDDPALLTNIGFNLLQGNFFQDAKKFLLQALEIDPNRFATRRELATVHIKLKEWEQAKTIIKKLKKEDPNDAMLLEQEANFYTSQGLVDEGIPFLKRALQINPRSLSALSSLLFSLNYSSQLKSSETIRHYISQYQQLMLDIHKPMPMRSHKTKDKRIRVGFVSGDLGSHPVGYFLANILPHFNKEYLTAIGITTLERTDNFAKKLKSMFHEWIDISHLSDEDAQKVLISNNIDILIDLSGHTAYNRLGLFSRRAAPTQLTWLGYFATTGIKSIDYILIDKPSLTPESQSQFTEKILELPGARLCFSPPEGAPDITPSPALNNGYITFGNYQNYSKVTDDVIATWIEILKKIPNAKLRVQNSQFSDKSLINKFISKFKKSGISPNRVSAFGPASRISYLQSHSEVDVLLDTFPFPGGTTTCEALWMGVPTISLVGNTLIQRQGLSLLSSANLADWCVDNKTSYIQKAIEVSNDINTLNNLRINMREKIEKTSLFDGAKLATELTNVFSKVYAEQNLKTGQFLIK